MLRRENTDVGTHNKFCRFVNQYEEHPLSETFNNQFFKTKMKMTIEEKKQFYDDSYTSNFIKIRLT